MALLKCHECGGMVSSTAFQCPHCGAQFASELTEHGYKIDGYMDPAGWKYWILIIILGAVGLLIAYLLIEFDIWQPTGGFELPRLKLPHNHIFPN